MFDNYIEKHGKRIYGLCLHLCASEQEAQDLYQETWLRALSSFDRFDKTRDFEPWITKICVNTYRNFLRRKRHEVTVPVKEEAAAEKDDHSELYAALTDCRKNFG